MILNYLILDMNIKELIQYFKPFNKKKFVYYANSITDLVLDY